MRLACKLILLQLNGRMVTRRFILPPAASYFAAQKQHLGKYCYSHLLYFEYGRPETKRNK